MEFTRKRSLYYRHKILLALLEVFGGRLKKTDLQKYLFLFTQEYQKDKSYEFIPYKYGCFSFQSVADKRKLTNIGVIKDVECWEITEKSNYLAKITTEDRENLILLRNKYKNIKGNNLIRNIYCKYPYYAIKSEISGQVMDKKEMKSLEQEKPSQTDCAFFTIGYEGKSFENYLNRLIKNNVRFLCDVRKNAFSRKYGFSKKILSKTLDEIGIGYIHMPELGIVSEKRQSLNSQADYDLIFHNYEVYTLKENRFALEELYKLFRKYRRVAITCFEADPNICHRNLVAKAISRRPDWEYEISHI